MDENKFNFFVDRFSSLGEEELAELHTKRNALADEACAALDKIFETRGVSIEKINLLAKEIEAENVPEEKRSKKKIAVHLAIVAVGVFIASVLSQAVSELAPAWLQVLIFLSCIPVCFYFWKKN